MATCNLATSDADPGVANTGALTQLSSNGTHAVSLGALDSLDTLDATKILIDGNTLIGNCNLLISRVTTKAFVTMAIRR